MRRITRRTLLAAGTLTAVTGGTYALTEAGVLPGQGRVARILGRCGTLPAAPAPAHAPGPVQEHSLDADGPRSPNRPRNCWRR